MGGEAVAAALVGHQLVAARRLGKVTLLDIDSGATLGIRFGMTGTLVVDGLSGWTGSCMRPSVTNPAGTGSPSSSRTAERWW